MLGMFVDGAKAPGLCVVWQGGTGFKVQRIRIYCDEVTILKGDVNRQSVDLRGKVTPDRVMAHVSKIFDDLRDERLPVRDLDD